MNDLARVGGMSRVEFFGLEPRRSEGARIALVFLAATYLADDIRVGDTSGERRGVVLDAGVHARLRDGFYALGGVGVAHRSTDVVIPDGLERLATTPRVVFAMGWASDVRRAGERCRSPSR